MNDDEIIQQRIAGRSVRAIAKAQGRSVAQVTKRSTARRYFMLDARPDARVGAQ